MEVTVSVAILMIITGGLFTFSVMMGRTARAQESKIITADDTRQAMIYSIRELRQAANASINWGSLPASSVSYRIANDINGNGVAVDANGRIELTGLRTIQRDTEDLNNDGMTNAQAVLVNNNDIIVIANNLIEDEDLNANNNLDPGEDRNANGRLDRGLRFEQAGRGIRITVQTESQSSPQDWLMMSELVEVVVPRN